MIIITISEFRRNTARIIQGLRKQDEFAVITRHGKPVVVIVNYERYNALIEREKRDAQTISNGSLQNP